MDLMDINKAKKLFIAHKELEDKLYFFNKLKTISSTPKVTITHNLLTMDEKLIDSFEAETSLIVDSFILNLEKYTMRRLLKVKKEIEEL